MAACTILATNYLAMGRVLAASFLAQHPGEPFFTLLIDGDASHRALTGLGEVVLPEDLALPRDQWWQMAAIYSVTELATAAKPALLELLLGRAPVAIYLDPDIKVYAPLTRCAEAAAEHALALTPHCLLPVPRDGQQSSEQELMLSGLFNLGFVAVGQRARPFLRWWRERLQHDAVVDVERGLFTDQRWVDWVPSLFEHVVLRDPGLNVAYWNVHERPLQRTPAGDVTAGGAPLSFFHFSGYDPAAPWRLSKHAVHAPRVRLPEHPVVEELCADYAADLERHEHQVLSAQPYRLGVLANGFHLTPGIRRMLRTAYVAGEQLPNPYLDPDGFVSWLSLPASGSAAFPVSRWELGVWQSRADLRAAFPDPGAEHAQAFRHWLDVDAAVVEERGRVFGASPQVLDLSTGRRQASVGWSVIAYADAELGVGEAGRRLARAVQQVGLPHEVVGVGETLSRRQHRHGFDRRTTPTFSNTITCVNADQLERIWHKVGLSETAPGRKVALWFWEADRVPERWHRAFRKLDQLWVVSEYTRDVFARVDLCPVELVQLPVLAPAGPTPHTRTSLGLPEDAFVFLCSYDFFSVLDRKNPLGVIKAYREAFGPEDGAALVLKSINGAHRAEDLARVRRAAGGRRDIHVVDGYRTAGEVAGMIELSDCVVSLHRSEGYGLNLVDAMAVGTPVVATAYSGNMTYMDSSSAFLVPYDEVEVGPGAEPYPADAVWADPDLRAAATILRAVFDDPASARVRGLAGRDKVLRENSLEVAGARLRGLAFDLLLDGVPA